MAEVILFVDAEDMVRLYLTGEFAARAGFTAVTAYAGKKPATLPAEFVFVRRTGGPARDMVTDAAQITLECYAKTGARAVAVAALARGLVGAAERAGQMGSATVYSVVEFAGPYLDPDPDAPLHTRYSATYSVAVRGSVA